MRSIWKKTKAIVVDFIFCCRLLYRSGRFMAVSAFLTNILMALLPFANFWLVKLLMDSLLALAGDPGGEWKRTAVLLALLAAAKMASGFLMGFVDKLSSLQIERLIAYINVSTMEKSMELDISYFDIPGNFDDLDRSRKNAHSLHQMVFAVSRLASDFLAFVMNLLLAAGISPFLCIAVILCALPQYYYRCTAERKKYGFEKSQYRERRFASYLQSLMYEKKAAKEIRLFGMGEELLGRYVGLQKSLAGKKNRFQNRVRLGDAMAGLPSAVILVLVKVYAARGILAGIYTLGDFTYIFGIFENLDVCARSMAASISVFTGYQERIADFRRYFAGRSSLVASGERRLERIDTVEFRHVSFAYPGSGMVLQDVSFMLSGKEKCMLAGLNGSGKTTLIKLLTRFYEPAEGDILVNGLPVGEYDTDSLRTGMAAVFQDYNVYSFTIRENVAIGDFAKMRDDSSLRGALEFIAFDNAAYAEEKNLDLPINRNFEAKGIELSGGQKQKLAIARAAVRDAGLVVLDEPTAALDPASEAAVMDAFGRLYQGRMLLMVSHRLSAALKMDKIIFMDSGRVGGIGAHSQLYETNEKYRRLFDIQADKYRD